ncbi:MAG: lactate 2-monooxygenase [Actinomycetota bacterium]|jgi:isopentenyl diphosphate isomerase/L-lactate dehydrogenase-like FMN-dependent dehydrogenase|nr:lactate 2-monooxygenase [Actinomycetota bacterium]
MSHSNFQNEIYLAGVGGAVPQFPVAMADLERKFEEVAPETTVGYVSGGAGLGRTMASNLRAFDKWGIVPRMLTNVEVRDTSASVLGLDLPAPVFLAPIGVQGIAHDNAEVEVATAARAVGVPMILSTVSSKRMEDVAETLGDTPRWFQLYWPRDRALTESFLTRAKAAGFSAVVVTLDTRILAWRPRDIQAGYLPFLRGEGIANYISDPVFRSWLETPPEEDMGPAIMNWVAQFSYPSTTWDDLAWLKEVTDLPIVLKGIQHPDDARASVEAGVQGIIVSNHGGRQVDGAIGSLDALPAVIDAVPEDFTVLFDSGIRGGSDAFKAIALGAQGVLLGRPYIWALTIGGAPAIEQMLHGFLAELDLTLALSGYRDFGEVNRWALTAT